MNKIIRTYSEFINESKYYQDTQWTMDIDGKEETITIKDIEEYLGNDPVVNIKVDDIKDKCIHLDKTDKETIERSQNSDLSFPIIITKNQDGTWGMILDGHHRLKKAIDNEIEYIRARIIDMKTVPELYKKMFS